MQSQWEFIHLTIAMSAFVVAAAWFSVWRTHRREGYADRRERVRHLRRVRFVLPIMAGLLALFAVAPLVAGGGPPAASSYPTPDATPPLGLGMRILSAAISAIGALVVISLRARLPHESDIGHGPYGFGGFHDLFRRRDPGDRS